MLTFLPRSLISPSRWNDMVLQSPAASPCALTPWLDSVTDNHWGALVATTPGGAYTAAFPLPLNLRRGYPRLLQPFFCQQLGPLAPDPADAQALLPQALAWADRHYPQIALNLPAHPDPLPHWPHRHLQRTNFLLDLNRPYAELRAAYRPTLRNLLSRPTGITIAPEPSALPLLIALYRHHIAPRTPEVRDRHYRRLQALHHHLSAHPATDSRILTARTPEGHLLAAALIPQAHGRLTYLFSAGTPEGRKASAMHHLLDHLVQAHAATPQVLDFEGSDHPSIAAFFQSFGPRPEPYLTLIK